MNGPDTSPAFRPFAAAALAVALAFASPAAGYFARHIERQQQLVYDALIG